MYEMKTALAILLAAALLFGGCNQKQTNAASAPSSTPAAPQKMNTSNLPGAPVSGEPVTTASGLKYYDMVPGTGASPTTGQTCVVNYTGWFTDGKKFDSSFDAGKPLVFPVGQGRVIKAWDEGIASMKIGGKRKLLVPSALGYGTRGFPGAIPPNSDLVFDVELLDVK
jgi:peptidylprolyl isomerase